jgi:hypothetical protein
MEIKVAMADAFSQDFSGKCGWYHRQPAVVFSVFIA